MSNFLWRRNEAMGADATGAVVRPAEAAQVPDAVRLILGSAHEGQVQEFIASAPGRGLDLALMWVAQAAGQVRLAVLPVISPGRTMLLLTSAAPTDERWQNVLGQLINQACAAGAERGVHLAQVLAEVADQAVRRICLENSFITLAELTYMQASLRPGDASVTLPQGMAWMTYGAAGHALFAGTILRTYQQSLDCPLLSGVREIDDVIAGHQACGAFQESNWLILAQVDGAAPQPLGVVLIGVPSRGEAAELIYLGLVPEARRRSVGQPPLRISDLLIREAMAVGARMRMKRLALAVDAGNAPALRLYHRHGFARVGSRVALMRDLRKGPREPGAV